MLFPFNSTFSSTSFPKGIALNFLSFASAITPPFSPIFCNAVFVAGYEMRDETNVPHDMLKRGIDIIQKIYETKKDVIEKNNKL